MSDNKARLELTAVDKTRAAFDSAKRNLSDFKDSASRVNGIISSLGIASAVGAGSLVLLAKSGIDAADALGDLSQRTGVSVKTLADWKLAATLADTDIETLAKGVQKLTLSIGQAEAGSKEQAAALQSLGVTARDPQQAFEQLADAVASSNDPIKTNADLQKVLGKNYSELLPLLQGGAQGLRESAAASQSFSEAMVTLAPNAAIFNDQLDTLRAYAAGAAASILAELVPSLNEYIAVGKEVVKNGTLLDKIRFFGLGNASDEVVNRVRANLAEAAKAMEDLRKKAGKDSAVDNTARLECIKSGGTWDGTKCIPKAKPAGKTIDKEALFVDGLAAGWKQAADEKARYDEDEAFVKQADLERANAINAIAQEWTEAGQALKTEMMTPLEQFEQRMDYINELWRRGAIDVETYDRAMEDLFGDKAEQISKVNDAAKEFGLTFTSALEDAIVNGEDLGDMLKALEQDIARMIVRMSITEPLMNAVSGTDWGALLGGLFASADGNVFMNSPGLSAYSGSVVSSPTVFPFASGMGLMGEAGPEAILPLKRGANGKLGVEGGGGAVQVNVFNNASGTQATTSEREENGVRIIDVMVEQVEGAMSRRLGRGEGLAPVMERRYGLNPGAGSN